MKEAFLRTTHETAIFIAAFFVCWAVLSFTLIKKRTDRVQNRLYIAMSIFTGIGALCNIVFNYAGLCADYDLIAYWLRYLSSYVYFSTHTLLIFLFFEYALYASGLANRMMNKGKLFKYILYLPVITAEVIALTNPLTKWVYILDNEMNRIRMPGEYVIYAVAGIYITAAVLILLIYWRMLSRQKRNALAYFLGIMFTGVIVQLVFSEIKSELFAEALALIGVMIILENEDDRIDISTGVYNRSALISDLKSYTALDTQLTAIAVHITNAEILQRLFGAADSDSLIGRVGEYLREICSRVYIYRPTPTCFLLVFPMGEEGLAEKLRERFQKPFVYHDAELMLNAVIMCAGIPQVLEKPEDIMLMADTPLPGKEVNALLRGKELEYLVRRSQVENALHRGVVEKNFEVYYQPVYRREGMNIYSAEALLRLIDSKVGVILPDEFIPLAEQNGMIDRLGEYVLEEVCMFLATGIPMEMGMDNISVNLSVVQCMNPDFVNRVLAVTEKYNVDPSKINLEITESAAASDMEALENVLNELKKHGFLFSMDDYGTGYSNIKSVFSLDYDLVKIDRSILSEASKEKKGRIILENTIRMIREMDLRVLVEGVENQEQIDLLNELNVDFLQGFYFSRPVSKNELLGILRVTELTRMEEQRARAASEAKSLFIANMSHEIRTPINVVLGMDEMILRESKNPQILEYARNMMGAGRTLLSLINDILDFSKIESGSMEITEREYELKSVINDVVNMIQIKADQKKLLFNVKVDTGMPRLLWGDEMRIRQIMVNVLNNAVKYTREGSVTLDISCVNHMKDRCTIKIEVSDTGIGIREDDLGRLFKKFTRIDEDRNKDIEGTGLGLAITYNLLQLMDGKIEARSEYGKGSTFTITIPQTVISREPLGRIDLREEDTPGINKYRESFMAPEARILVVDDTPVNHTVINELLKRTKVSIDTAMSGMECLEHAAMTKYDLILLDYRMPEMDGIETLKQLKALPDNMNTATPIVALTANAVTGAREIFLKEGFDDYMTKPVNYERLEELLITYLPAEKVTLTRNVYREENKLKPAMQGIQEMLPGIDVETGVRNCGSEEGYRNVLKIYYDGYDAKKKDIENYLEKKDWENYTIQVHSLKSSSRVIGANALGELAAGLEEAGNAGDEETLTAGSPGLLAEYNEIYEELKRYFGNDADDNGDEGKEDISDEMLADALLTIKDFAKLYDYDNIIYVLDSLKEYRLKADDAEKIKKIREYTESFRWEDVLGLIE